MLNLYQRPKIVQFFKWRLNDKAQLLISKGVHLYGITIILGCSLKLKVFNQFWGSLNQTINIVQFVFHSMKDVVPAQEVCMFPCIHDSNSLPICLILFETMSVNAEFFEAPNPHGSMACTRHVYDKICVCALQTYSWV